MGKYPDPVTGHTVYDPESYERPINRAHCDPNAGYRPDAPRYHRAAPVRRRAVFLNIALGIALVAFVGTVWGLAVYAAIDIWQTWRGQ